MKKKGLYIIGISITSIFLLLLWFPTIISKSKSQSYEITLKQAMALSLTKARSEWDSNAAVYRVTSVDDKEKGSKGVDGKRRYWNLILGVANTDKQLIITIHDKKITNFISRKESLLSSKDLILEKDFSIDSSKSLILARKKYHLKPGKEWAEGYHYGLMKSDNKVILTVTGLNKENKFTKVRFDARNGTSY